MTDLPAAMISAYDGTSPAIAAPLAFAGPGAAVLGRATIGPGAWLGESAVVRADGHYVKIGEDFHLGDHATVHIAHDIHPTHIGNRVTAAACAVIHACDVGDDCVVGHRAVILDGSTVGPGAVLAANAVVFPRSTLEGGWLYAGSPAKPVARVTPQELEAHHRKLRSDRCSFTGGGASERTPLDVFVAPSALVLGDVRAGDGVGIWYGCHLDAGAHRIEIGAGTNVQDNSRITCVDSDVSIAPDVTIGHNVTLTDCRVEADSLVGIGAVLAPGTVVESDVLVAAGAETEPGQRLTSGQVWAGIPARAIGRMDERKRAMLSGTLPTYRDYAQRFRAEPHPPLADNLAR